MKQTSIFLLFFLLSSMCGYLGNSMAAADNNPKGVPNETVIKVIGALTGKYGADQAGRIEKGVRQASVLWRETDGTPADFENFCMTYYIGSDKERDTFFAKFSRNFEILNGHFNKITLDLKEPTDLDEGEIYPIDQLFSGYDVSAHLKEDFYQNKIAFMAALNFPLYSLEEKNRLGPSWSSKDWAFARLGDVFALRIPPALIQDYSNINSNADLYISEYNIFMGHVLSEKGKKLFPEDLCLLTHWNLRDELKANYGLPSGLEKQKIIYEVMKQIISQDIPQTVINNPGYDWNPYTKKVYKDGKEIEAPSEPNTRYRHLLNNFLALKAMDPYCPGAMSTYIQRKFDGEMEISQKEVEDLFIKMVSSPQIKKLAQLIQKRLNRRLEPFDIWYNGFVGRSGIPEEKLDSIVREKYPDVKALENDLPNILVKLGFPKEKANFIASKIAVDDARGSGHAWQADMRSEKSHLRTRMPDSGMNYKGYNIAIHEFGHNVEQTISLHDVPYYMMRGVPNTSFTEALAFIFQRRDLDLLGMKENNPDKNHLITLDSVWSAYEIMGVSLVDMYAWKWMYANPDCTPQQLKEAVTRISIEVWNKYFAPVFGIKDQPILGIYSHMISYPLYLSAYSFGQLIDFQVEQYIEGKDLAPEVLRMYSTGTLIPNLWMKKAVGNEISIEPILKAVDLALKKIKK